MYTFMERPPSRCCDDVCAHDHAEQYPLLVAVVMSLGLFIVAIVWYIYLLAPLHLYCPFPVALGSCGHGVFIADLCMIEMLSKAENVW